MQEEINPKAPIETQSGVGREPKLEAKAISVEWLQRKVVVEVPFASQKLMLERIKFLRYTSLLGYFLVGIRCTREFCLKQKYNMHTRRFSEQIGVLNHKETLGSKRSRSSREDILTSMVGDDLRPINRDRVHLYLC